MTAKPPTSDPRHDLELDADGYPTEATLAAIRAYPITNPRHCKELLDAVRDVWLYADCGYYEVDGSTYKLSTGGWSGNEDTVSALQDNFIFWSLCWMSHRRGGHYEFDLSAVIGSTP